MRAEIIKLRKRIDTTFIYVTHAQTEAMTLGDRIVIMKDGVVQQVGTPQELFDHPANLFVAGFIGMPRMNLFDADLIKVNGKYAVKMGDVVVTLDEEKQARLDANNVAEQAVTLGVRPENLSLEKVDGPMVHGTVDVYEMMGSEIHYHVTVGDKDVIIIVPTVGMKDVVPMGADIPFTFAGNVAHIFCKETEKNLEF